MLTSLWLFSFIVKHVKAPKLLKRVLIKGANWSMQYRSNYKPTRSMFDRSQSQKYHTAAVLWSIEYTISLLILRESQQEFCF